MQYGFYFDAGRCTGCNVCAIACKDWNDIKPGDRVHWRRVTTIESGKYPNVRLANTSFSCMHCGKPACQSVCPVSAISKRTEDGIVVVDQTQCIGCRACSSACPFGVPEYGADGTMQKCNLCLEKVKQGKQPECAASCTGGALFAGPLDALARIAAQKTAKKLVGATQPSMLIPASK